METVDGDFDGAKCWVGHSFCPEDLLFREKSKASAALFRNTVETDDSDFDSAKC